MKLRTAALIGAATAVTAATVTAATPKNFL
jgi:hypothetical protein